MKENIISYQGIKTNNLKDLNLNILKGSFLGIGGRSGSGKSSLAYNTIYAVSEFEWEKVSNGSSGTIPNFKVDSYKNILPAIALKQENYNTNPRSTVATLLKIDKDFRLIFSTKNGVSPSLFTFNNPSNACPYCEGLGIQSSLSFDQMVNFDKNILEGPFQPWKKSYKEKVLLKFAEAKNISLTTKLSDLPKEHLNSLLYDKSSGKFKVTYTANNKKRTKEFAYIGLFVEMQNLKEDKKHISSHNKLLDYTTSQVCSHCKGTRFAEKILKYKYNSKDIGELYTMEFSELSEFILKSSLVENNDTVKGLLTNIGHVLYNLIESNLDYLHLNRSIPTLSGGELQRIRLVNILTSHISGMMYIVDEPSSKLHVSEYESILQSIYRLQNNQNTILMIEHNLYFLNRADKIIFLGPGSGEKGGYIIDDNTVVPKSIYIPKECNSFLTFENVTKNNIYNLSLRIPLNRITGIYGPSGSGKSTLVKYIAEVHKKSEFISQKPIRGSIVSTIASYSGVLEDLRNYFSDISSLPQSYFSFFTEEGQCPYCKGKGVLRYTLDFGKTEVEIICEECNGKRFNETALKAKYKGLSIYEILMLTIDAIIDKSLFDVNSSLYKKLLILQKLGLGYLNLFRTTDTLSGGEAQRLKLTKYIGKKLKDKLFIFDEPLSGLSKIDVYNVLEIFNELVSRGSTVIFIDHNILGLDSIDYIIEMGPGKGKHGGKITFEGEVEKFKRSKHYEAYESVRT